MSENKEGIQVYELGYLILPSLAEDAISGVVDKLKGVVTKAGGNIFESEDPFKTELSYTMTKTIGASRYVVNEAYIGWMKFELSPEAVEGVKDELDKADELVRLLLMKAPRETIFTFEKAKAIIAEKIAAEERQKEEEETPAVVE